MLPRIRFFSNLDPSGHWFDIGQVETQFGFELDPERLCHLPYEQTNITGADAEGNWFCVRYWFTGETVAIAGLVAIGKLVPFLPFAYVNTEEGLRIIPPARGKLPPRKDVLQCLAILDMLLSRLEARSQPCFTRVKKTTGLAARKAKPTYEWKVLKVEPRTEPTDTRTEPTEPTSSTHASPRAHDRRGHWRSLPTGRKIWVNPCRVGDPDNGIVLKDYLVT